MRADRFVTEARSLRFYKGVAMTRTKEIIALVDWGYQFCLISHSPCPDIPGFLQQSCFGSSNAAHDVPEPPLRIMLETADVRKRSRMLWVHLCCLLQFWTDEAGYLEGNAFYGGLVREQSYLVQYVMMAHEQPDTGGDGRDLEGRRTGNSVAKEAKRVFRNTRSRSPSPTGSGPAE